MRATKAIPLTLVGLFVPMMLGIYFEPQRPVAALASMLQLCILIQSW